MMMMIKCLVHFCRYSPSQDPQLQTAMKFVRHGWPDYIKAVPPMIQDLYPIHAELSIAGDLLLRDSRIVAPQALHAETLEKLHEGHLRVYKCKGRAKTAELNSPRTLKALLPIVAFVRD